MERSRAFRPGQEIAELADRLERFRIPHIGGEGVARNQGSSALLPATRNPARFQVSGPSSAAGIFAIRMRRFAGSGQVEELRQEVAMQPEL